MHTRHLRFAAHVELISLAAMLANLATAHLPALTSLLGPLHGCAYLFVVGATWRHARATNAARATAVVPGIGGLLALRRITRGPGGERTGETRGGARSDSQSTLRP